MSDSARPSQKRTLDNAVSVRRQIRRKAYAELRFALLLLGMAVVLLLCILFSVSIGVAGGGIGSLFHALVQSLVHPSDLSDIGRIMLEMRIPRALAACLVGAALALAGAVMQGITRNPLADAGLLGINAGAGLFVALGAVILPALSSFSLMLASFFGAAAAALMVFGFGTGRHGAGTIRLILAGAAVSAFLTALSQGVSLTFGLSKELSFWGSGSLSGISWEQLAIAAPWLVGAVCAGLFLSHNLSMLALGEESAAGLGLNVRLVRLAGLATVLVLAGTSVSLAGGISFLGLIVPHSARLLVGTDYRRVLPVSVFLGAILLVLSDVAARMIHAPFDTPVGALVSIIGVPVLLALTYRKRGLAL